MMEPDIVALGGRNVLGTSWAWTRLSFNPIAVGWNILDLPKQNDGATCLGFEMGNPTNATIFPCLEPKRIICN
jgi:hypothetical protein